MQALIYSISKYIPIKLIIDTLIYVSKQAENFKPPNKLLNFKMNDDTLFDITGYLRQYVDDGYLNKKTKISCSYDKYASILPSC